MFVAFHNPLNSFAITIHGPPDFCRSVADLAGLEEPAFRLEE